MNYVYYDNHYGNEWQTGTLIYSVNDNVQETLYDIDENSGVNIVGSGDYEPGFSSYDVYVDTDAVRSISFSCN